MIFLILKTMCTIHIFEILPVFLKVGGGAKMGGTGAAHREEGSRQKQARSQQRQREERQEREESREETGRAERRSAAHRPERATPKRKHPMSLDAQTAQPIKVKAKKLHRGVNCVGGCQDLQLHPMRSVNSGSWGAQCHLYTLSR